KLLLVGLSLVCLSGSIGLIALIVITKIIAMSSPTIVTVKTNLERWFEDQCAARQMTKKDVAEAIGISTNLLGRLLNAPEKADAKFIVGLATVFQVGCWTDILVKEFGFGTDQLTWVEWDRLGKNVGVQLDFTQSVAA
ncbi:MAG: helix-turn-helix transcriptional regulator, partial [Bacteroidota bacterium]